MANDDEFAPAEYVSDEEQVNDEIEIQAVKKKAKTFFIFHYINDFIFSNLTLLLSDKMSFSIILKFGLISI